MVPAGRAREGWHKPWTTTFYPVRGLTLSYVLDSLKDLISRGKNVGTATGDAFRHRDAYISWVEVAETQLRHLFIAPIWQGLHTDRYWQLLDINEGTPRPSPLIVNETDWQVARLQRVFDQLERAQRDYGLPEDTLAVVPDTSVLMEYAFYDEIDWPAELKAGSVRLVIPLLVIDELDDLSFRSNPRSERARKVIRALRTVRGSRAPEVAVAVRRGVELQILPDAAGHRRRPNDDDETLARAEFLGALVGSDRVRVVAADYGMQLRASSRGLQFAELRDDLRRPPTVQP